MDAWIVILAIVLLRGLGAWMRRRNEQQRRQQEAESGQPRPRPQPGDPDAFDLEDVDPYGEETFSWENETEPETVPETRRPEPTRRLPDTPSPRGRERPDVVVLSEAERKRQEYLQRLAQVATDAAARQERRDTVTAPPRRHPVASVGVRISHDAERAANLRRRLISPRSLREAWLVREVLGPPVARRGPLRGPGELHPR